MCDRFLPVSREDMKKRGWDQVDFAYIIGDAYVDHPSFGHAIISRLLESRDTGWALSLSRTEGSEERMYLRRASARLPSPLPAIWTPW